jgi:hypothetical protein
MERASRLNTDMETNPLPSTQQDFILLPISNRHTFSVANEQAD